jgi:signal transduction histidine kinase
VPLVFEGRLHGILVLGTRSGGDVYSDQDIQIIATVAHQGALAAANVMLVEDLRGLAQQLVRSDEDQRKRLARDLHDAVLQDLFIIKQRLPRDQNYPELGSHLEGLIQKLRRLIKAQRPALLDQGIVLALSGLVGEMGKLAGPSTKLTWQSELEGRLELSDEQATSVFRIAQEALSNALKHAAAQNIDVKLERRHDGVLRLVVEDDGVGFGEGEASLSPQYGLVGMRERARMIDASLEVKARTQGGTTVALEFLP